MIVAAALLVVASLLGVAALSLVIVGVGRNRRKGGFAGRNQPVDDRLPDKLTALGRDRCQRLQLFGIMFSCHFNSPSVCKTMLTGRQRIPARANARGGSRQRSEEHTSELQSLMRISYAVFCLKKKKKH